MRNSFGIIATVSLLLGEMALSQTPTFDPDESLVREFMIGDWNQAPGELTNTNVVYSMRLYRDGTAIATHTYPKDGYKYDFLGTWSVSGRNINVPHHLNWIKKGQLSSDGTYVGIHNDNDPEIMLKNPNPVLPPELKSRFDVVCDHIRHQPSLAIATAVSLEEAIAASAKHIREPGNALHEPKFRPATTEASRRLSFLIDHQLDALNRQKFSRIIETSKATVARIRRDTTDPRLYFLETQQLILEKLNNSDFFKNRPLEFDWLTRVVNRFMNSLELAILGRFAIKGLDDASTQHELDAVMASTKAGFWWKPAIEDIERIRSSHVTRPWPAPQLDEWVAAVFMLGHIDGDLQMALALEGIGSDAAYAEVGKIVQEAWDQNSRFPRAFIEWGTIFEPVLRGLDPMTRRTRIREHVQKMHAEAGILNPRRGARLVIKNGENQVESPTTMAKKFRAGCVGYHEGAPSGTFYLGDETTREIAEQQAAAHRTANPKYHRVYVFPTGPPE
jgi:hypothetical protein